MALRSELCIVLVVLVLAVSINAEDDYVEEGLDAREQEAVYRVLEAINSEIDWRSMYPDNLCTGGPHGVVCELDMDEGRWHIVELNLGWVADSANNPPCGKNASFSPHLAYLRHIRKLLFYKCFMHARVSIPAYIWDLGDTIEELVFQDNPTMEGFLPPEMGMLTAFRRFILSGSSIGGSIPAEIGNLKKLHQLVLSGNSLRGRIPSSLGELKKLVVLDLNHNQLDGSVPPQLGGLVSMAKIDLSFNRLDGAIPASLALLRAIELLDMSHNNLSGGVPLFLAKMQSLVDLHLSGNPLGGVIPDVWDFPGCKLRSLGLSSAGLVGRIPESMGGMKIVRYLALDNNRLTGFIPAQLGSMEQVYEMNLSGNELTGVVPFSAEFVKKMGTRLRLEGNSGLCSPTLWLPQPTLVQHKLGGSSQTRSHTFLQHKLLLLTLFAALLLL